MDDVDVVLELVISSTRGAVPVRLPIAKRITTIGANEQADVRLLTVPDHWAVVHRQGSAVRVRLAGDGTDHTLGIGESMEVDGVELRVEAAGDDTRRDAAIEALVSELTNVESPDRALRLILHGVLRAAQADTGAVILTEQDSYTVAAACDADGKPLDDAALLLSDTIVRDVLGTGARVCLDDIAAHGRYAQIPSVVSLQLQSVICLPMRVDGRTLGAVFLGKRDARRPLSDKLAQELRMLTAMAVPFLAQLRRGQPAGRQDDILGDSSGIVELRRLIARVGPTDLSVLVLGPSGCGKELVARALHHESPRAARALIAINCAAVPESLLAAELFGYRKGAFTSAISDRKGLIEAAHGSTLFLDEVGDMPLSMQASLLRVLEAREVTRLGEHHPRAVDFRLVAATNRDLEDEVRAGRFREDLLFRLKEMTVSVPPLQEREDDVVLLARCFLRQTENGLGLAPHSLSSDAVARLRAHGWPGNVRELKATMRRAAILAEGRVIEVGDLGLAPGVDGEQAMVSLGDTSRPLAEARDAFIKDYVEAVVQRCGGNRERAAKELQIGVRTLYRYLA